MKLIAKKIIINIYIAELKSINIQKFALLIDFKTHCKVRMFYIYIYIYFIFLIN